MNTTVSLEAWCVAIESALADDSPESWAVAVDAFDGELTEAELPADPAELARQLDRLRSMAERISVQRATVLDELDAIGEERRQLVTHSKAVTSYRMAETLGPVDRLMRMMWVG